MGVSEKRVGGKRVSAGWGSEKGVGVEVSERVISR